MKIARLITFAILAAGCTGDPGPMGPAGEPGPPGLDGESLVAVISWDNLDGAPLASDDFLFEVTADFDRLVTAGRFLYAYGYVLVLFPGDDPETEADLQLLPVLLNNPEGQPTLASFTVHSFADRTFLRFRQLRGFYVVGNVLIFSRPTSEAETQATITRISEDEEWATGKRVAVAAR